jgi:hypothetical protein
LRLRDHLAVPVPPADGALLEALHVHIAFGAWAAGHRNGGAVEIRIAAPHALLHLLHHATHVDHAASAAHHVIHHATNATAATAFATTITTTPSEEGVSAQQPPSEERIARE